MRRPHFCRTALATLPGLLSWRGVATLALLSITVPIFMAASVAALSVVLIGFACDELRRRV